ncbi:hypothetical protein EIP86_000323 [Pleurotus ostreatoroseus]|nr:hypothetical protein EIP86_000323 [Pleurotus ostreatoroseus]
MSDPYPPSPDTPPEENPEAIRLTIPPRYYLLPGAAVILGTTLGLLRGSRRESLRFLAENVHRPPTTVRGWYLYNKTKNYRVMMGGLRQAGMDAGRLAAAAAVFVGVEEVAERMGGIVGEVGDVLAGIGTGAVFSMLYRLPRRQAGRMVAAGMMIGGLVSGLRWSKAWLGVQREAAKAQVAEQEAAAAAPEHEGADQAQA